MAPSDDAIKQLLEWYATSSQTNREWSPRKKAAEAENHKYTQPSVIQSMRHDELEKRFKDTYNTDTGYKANIIKINRDRIIQYKIQFRKILSFMFNEIITMKERLNKILTKEYNIQNFCKSIVTAFLINYKHSEYCLWNNKVKSGFTTLGWLFRQRGNSPGRTYLRVLVRGR